MPPFLVASRGVVLQQRYPRATTATGILAEWLRRLIRNQLGTFPREFESLRCRRVIFLFYIFNKKTQIGSTNTTFLKFLKFLYFLARGRGIVGLLFCFSTSSIEFTKVGKYLNSIRKS